MSTEMGKNSNPADLHKGSQPGRIRLQGLALGLFLFCPLAAFFSWQAGLTLLSGLFTALVGLAFVLTIARG